MSEHKIPWWWKYLDGPKNWGCMPLLKSSEAGGSRSIDCIIWFVSKIKDCTAKLLSIRYSFINPSNNKRQGLAWNHDLKTGVAFWLAIQNWNWFLGLFLIVLTAKTLQRCVSAQVFRINNRLIQGLQTPREEIAFTARPKIQSQSQIFRYGRGLI